jgi:nitroreductase
MMNTGPQVSTRVNDPASVDAAILSRFSARAYLQKPVDRVVLQEVLSIAGRAPSGTNTQPWKVYVLQGAKRDELVAKTCAAHDAISANPALAVDYAESYDYYPEKWVSPYIDRRRECGFGLYGVLGIGKGDKAMMHAQHQKNFRFFDAPVGLIFTIDKVMGRAVCSTTACSCKASWWPHARVACTPARKRLGTVFPKSSCRWSARVKTKWWSAACRWVMPTNLHWSTPLRPHACQGKTSPTGWTEALPQRAFLMARV